MLDSDPRARARSARAASLTLSAPLDRSADAPLPVQLAAQIRDAIDRGVLRAGESVPATRELGRQLGVARGVVVAAYEQLIAEGYLSAGHGRGTTVHPELRQAVPSAPVPQGSGPRSDPRTAPAPAPSPAGASRPLPRLPGPLAPGRPISDAVDRPAWRSAWRTAAARAHLAAPELGDPRLRAEIAEHLRRMRGTARDAEDVIVTAGAREGLGLVLTALGTTRGRALAVGVEDPGYPSLRGVAARHGAQVFALPADADGLDTARLPEGVLDVVIVTPSHQYPLGGSLPLARRRELLDWARRRGVVIVEDDYDSELRHSGSPLPTLAALDDPAAGAVLLLGTFSQTIAPALSAGFLLAPSGLRGVIEPVREELGGPVSTVVQTALAEFLATGELRRHTARMRRRYAIRRELVGERLAGIAGVRVRPTHGGLHAVVELGPGAGGREREAAAVRRIEQAGLGGASLERYWQRRERIPSAHSASGAPGGSAAPQHGIVIGLGGADEAEFDRALRHFREILEAD
ncbi:PLP-dependent aminotransferase family protein [Leucobacter iarius]|uniref:Pyridoxine biosynthesis transcriptional regulator PdxR n=1 Tax=Leucobacter iarius TaxID=333963 RepID=A0ABP4XND5_9MICO